jgi:carbon monoxide dehydrogenase subunit G
MEINGERTIDQTPDQLWETILDADVLEQTIPGAESLERDGDRYEGTLERGLAGITVTLSVDVEITEKDRPDWLECDIEGTDNRINSRVDGDAHVDFEAIDEDKTNLVYDTEFNFSGKLASLGSRIIKRKVNNDLETFFSNLGEYAEEGEAAA